LNCQDVVLGTGAHVRCLGKGRKERSTPLRPETATMLDAWLRERHGLPEDPVFPTLRGGRLSRDAIEHLITKYNHLAEQDCPSLERKKVSPHVLRHYLPFLTMSSDIGPRRAHIGRIGLQRGCGERIARHSLLDRYRLLRNPRS
jgi:integrase/recombinase XerD